MIEVTVEHLREHLDEILQHVWDTHQHVILMRDNRPVACLISLEQLDLYQESDHGPTLEEMARDDTDPRAAGVPLAEAMRQARALRHAREGR
jgi:PHD/YefM family antitoxin component YafN of YafNO toxin-antitoxin module